MHVDENLVLQSPKGNTLASMVMNFAFRKSAQRNLKRNIAVAMSSIYVSNVPLNEDSCLLGCETL
jgi:hypothetical protein